MNHPSIVAIAWAQEPEGTKASCAQPAVPGAVGTPRPTRIRDSTSRLSRRQFVRDTGLAAAGVVAGVIGLGHRSAQAADSAADRSKILNYHPDMEYRRLGKTDLRVSVVGLGGHARSNDQERREVVRRCLDAGINFIDSTGSDELQRDLKALGDRRKQVYLGISETGREPRNPEYRTATKLLAVLDDMLHRARLDYADIWRITMYEPGGRHSFDESCAAIEALQKAKQQGKARFIGISSHDRRWLKFMVEYFPQLEVVLFPFTTMTKAAPKDSLFESLKKCDVGAFGIKPFAAGSLFTGKPDEDLKRARLALRYILHSQTVIPIPGLNTPAEVDNVVKAVQERRQLDLPQPGALRRLNQQMLANLPPRYQWLRDWELV